ncbi:MAG: hypothetical protein LLG06_12900 [Desulfobacteraceae bacterium]|nr:hypothetical protein [Desulfobacteraceae bacterium]
MEFGSEIRTLRNALIEKIKAALGPHVLVDRYAGEERAKESACPSVYIQYVGGIARESEEIGAVTYQFSPLQLFLGAISNTEGESIMTRKIKVLLVLTMIVAMISACATYQVSQDPSATSADKKAALCMDAQNSLAMADAGLSAAQPGSDGARYWTAFRTGAQIGINAYCGTKVPVPME